MLSSSYIFEGWQSITLRQFNTLTHQIQHLEGDELVFKLCSILFDVDETYLKKSQPYVKLKEFATKVLDTFDSLPEKQRLKEINGYRLPKMIKRLDGSWWSDATFEQVQAVMSETQRIQEATDKSAKLNLEGFALMCATLFQKKGEIVTDEIILQREREWLEVDMFTIWQAFFLFQKWQRITLRDLKLYSKVVAIWLKWLNLVEKLKGKFKRSKTE